MALTLPVVTSITTAQPHDALLSIIPSASAFSTTSWKSIFIVVTMSFPAIGFILASDFFEIHLFLPIFCFS